MTRSKLKSKANKSGKQEDLKACNKQQTLVLKLNRQAKKNFLKSCIFADGKMKNENFWKLCRLFFIHCVRSVQILSIFWSAFSCIRTEYRDLLSKSPHSVRIYENTDQRILRVWTLFAQS